MEIKSIGILGGTGGLGARFETYFKAKFPKIKVKVSVKGSWDDPKIDLKPALMKVVFEVTKSTLINKYVPEEYKDAAQEVGNTISEGLNSLFGGDKKK
jgi:hypothetical protein